MPAEWEDAEQLITGEQTLIIKDIAQGSNEWSGVAMNFKLT